MVWNTALIWLMAVRFLAGTAGLGLLATGGILGVIVVPIAFAVFVIPAAVTGICLFILLGAYQSKFAYFSLTGFSAYERIKQSFNGPVSARENPDKM